MKKLPPIAASLLAKQARGLGASAVAGARTVPRNLWLMVLAACLLLGLVFSILDLIEQPTHERAYAKHAGQRVVFVGKSNESVDGALPQKNRVKDFDVEESPEEKKLKQSTEKKTPETNPPEISTKETTSDESVAAPDIESGGAPADAPSNTGDDSAKTPVETPPTEVAAPEATPEDMPATSNLTALVIETHAKPLIISRSADSLVFAPAPEISKRTKQGLLPVKGENHTSPADIYARGFRPSDDTKLLAIVITGLGFSTQAMVQALALPPEITLSVSPYASNIDQQIDSARNGGHEIWFDLPTQTADYPATDPGPLGIMETLKEKDRNNRIEQIMIATRGAVGAMFWPEDSLLNNGRIFEMVVKKIRDHGLRVFYTNPAAPEIDGKTLQHSDYLIRKTATPSKISSELQAIGKQLAELKKPTILVVEASPHSVRALADWLPALKKMPLTLAPLSALYLDFEAIKAAEEKAMEEAGKDAKKESGGH